MRQNGKQQTRAAVFAVAALCVLSLVFAMKTRAQSCFLNPPVGPVVVYDEQLHPGWSTANSLNVTVNPNPPQCPVGADGVSALLAQFTAGGAILELSRSSISTTFLDTLTFWIEKGDAAGNIFVTARFASNSALGTWVPLVPNYLVQNASTPSFVPQQWYKVSVPLSAMGIPSGTPLSGILFTSSTATTAYFDDIGIVTAFLQFPLANRTPYTMRVVAIQDHDDTSGKIQAYDGEIGSGTQLCYDNSCKQIGYPRSDVSGPFVLSLVSYDEGTPVLGAKAYIWYDNHHGYDYAENDGSMATGNYPVHAAASGYLCVGNNTTTGNGVDLWRNPSYCTIVNAQTTTSINRTFDSNSNSTTQWDYYHAIYIVHANAYSSWYLHVADILPTLKSQVVQNGYVWVNKGDQIATVGNFAYGYPGGVAYHLHFGVRNYNGVRADPYGNDSFSLGMHSNFNLLWQQRPQ